MQECIKPAWRNNKVKSEKSVYTPIEQNHGQQSESDLLHDQRSENVSKFSWKINFFDYHASRSYQCCPCSESMHASAMH